MCQGRPMKRKNTMMTNPPTSSLRSPPEGLIHTISPDIYASPAAAAPATNNDNNENAPDININNTMTIQEDATCYVLSIKLPNGVNGNDVGVSLQGNILTISGYRRRQYCSDASSLLSSNVDDDAASSSSSTTSLFDYHRHKSHSNNSNSSSNNMNNNSNDMNIDNDNAYAYGVTAKTVSPPSSDSEFDQQYQYQEQQQQQQQQQQHTIDNNNQNYSSTSSSSRSAKRQRLVNQEFEIDTTAIDLDRAIANTWNGSLTLYAPKKQQRSR